MAAELEQAYTIEAARIGWLEHRRVYGARRLTAEVRDRALHRSMAHHRLTSGRGGPSGVRDGAHGVARG